MTTLVMFSGGIDSTAMLVKLLTEGTDELRVHPIHMQNREGRDAAEAACGGATARASWASRASNGSTPVYGLPKAEIAAALPAGLLDLTWSCRRPAGGSRPCLECKACKARQFAQGLRTPAEAAQNQTS